eukprot:TRINITY_DN3142_c3_g1_i1.p1 TRINITY_DN3142_c3_g1~~TRINITY_DN3142_c3_g1_i1.p1  ORF type:complete len:542 (+),score=113.78 TRINITY_DN3142_c3_g1_i1:52-1626(+)
MDLKKDDILPAITVLFMIGWIPLLGLALLLLGMPTAGLALELLFWGLITRSCMQRPANTPPFIKWGESKYTGPSRLQMYMEVVKEGPDVIVRNAQRIAKGFNYETFGIAIPSLTLISGHTPEHVKHVTETKFQNYVKGSYFHKVFKDTLGDGIFNSDGAPWKLQRRVSSHLFSAWQLENRMSEVFQKHTEQLLAILSDNVGGVVDIQQLCYCFTFDCIYEIAFGKEVNSLGGNTVDVEFQKAFDTVQRITANRFLSTTWQIKRFLNIGDEREMAESLKVIRKYVNDVMQERLAESAKRKEQDLDESCDLLGLLESHSDEIGDTAEKVIDFITNFTIAGRDTTASALTWMFYELSKHPEHREPLIEEFKSIENYKDMEFSQAVIQETLRLWPSVPFDLKFALGEDILPCGTKVYPGVAVMYNPLLCNKNPKYYPEPEEFMPSRWMEKDGTCRRYDPKGFAYPTFNAGSRICLGRHMATLEIKTVMSAVLSEFVLDLEPGFEPDPCFTVVMMSKNGLRCTVQRRQK